MILSANNIHAQPGKEISISTHLKNFSIKSDTLYTDIQVTVNRNSLGSRSLITVAPIISDSSRVIRLIPVKLYGKLRYKEHLRENRLAKNRIKGYVSALSYNLLKSESGEDTVDYHHAIPLKDWMQDCFLDVEVEVSDRDFSNSYIIRLADSLSVERSGETYTFKPHISYVFDNRVDTLFKYLSVDFPANLSELSDSRLSDIDNRLRQIRDSITENGCTNIVYIEFLGYSSSADNIQSHRALAEKRTLFLESRFGKLFPEIPEYFYKTTLEYSSPYSRATLKLGYENVENQTLNTRMMNRVSELIFSDKLLEAKSLLPQIDPSFHPADYENIVGVLYLMEGNIAEGEQHLKKAVKFGSQDAALNLKEIPNLIEQDE